MDEAHYLHRIQPTVSVQRKPNDVGGVLVPACIDRVAHDVPCLWEDLLDQCLLSAQCNPFPEIRSDPYNQAVTGLEVLPLFLLLFPSLQLLDHRLQLVVLGLFV